MLAPATPLLFRFGRFEAMNQECGTLARDDFFRVGLLGAVTLPDLLGAALLGRLAKLRGHSGGINDFLRGRRGCDRDCAPSQLAT